eukprot:c5796_g1_i3.p1 GENE.c5796_g1_i3~~c5796_g1_i3.p1  ORF type:complete len:753 (+),score=156.48 c5796_g1_i3:279-2261(+)
MHTGITLYQWAARKDRLMFVRAGDVYIQDGYDHKNSRKILDQTTLFADANRHTIIDPKLSVDGNRITFVCDSEVYMCECEPSSRPVQLTSGAREFGLTNGLADYIAQEEMDRYDGYWLSDDGEFLAFQQVDDRHIPTFRISHMSAHPPTHEDHKYPFAGASNPLVKLGVTSTSSPSTVVWLPLEEWVGADLYLARVMWYEHSVVAQIQSRDQGTLRIVRFNITTGQGTCIHTELGGYTSDYLKTSKPLANGSDTDKRSAWVNLHQMLLFLSADEFLWASECDGFRHLYRIKVGGEVVQLTKGEWIVDLVVAVHEAAGLVYFVGTYDSPTERHLYSVSLNGDPSSIKRITAVSGYHTIVMNSSRTLFVDVVSSAVLSYEVHLCSISGEKLFVVHSPSDTTRLKQLRVPEYVSFPAADNETTLYACYLAPDPNVHGKGPYPTMVFVYGGPCAQYVVNSWTATCDMKMQYYAQLGYLVVKIDNRGSSRRGIKFELALQWDMGNVELDDQVCGVQYFVSKGLVDPTRVGIMGWSYGGYLSAMAVAKRSDVFKLAIAGAPVTDWDGYDTHYTERYMSTPALNPRGYSAASVLTHVNGLKSSLLLIHGLIDENVHFRHSTRLISALVKAKKNYEVLLFPDARHAPRSLDDRIYLEERCLEFITKNL